MKKQHGRKSHWPPRTQVQPAAKHDAPLALPVLEYIPVSLMAIDPEMRIIGINEACRATLLGLCGRHINVGENVSAVPIQIETSGQGSSTLEAFCRQSLSGEASYIAGRCVSSTQSRSMLFRLTPVLDGFLRPMLLHITIQDFPGNAAVDAANASGDISVAGDRRPESLPQIATEDMHLTFDSAPVGIAHVAPDGRFLHVNRFLSSMLGYSHEELLSMTYQDVTYSQDLDADNALVQEVLQGKRTSYVLEKRYLHKNGSPIWAYLAVTLIKDDSGAPRYFISVISNIHDRKKASAEIEESRARLKAVFDSLSEAVFVFNTEGKIIDANPAGLRMFGYLDIADADGSVTELNRHFEASTLDSQSLPLERWPIYRVLRGERVTNVELKIRQVSTGQKWVASFSGSPASACEGMPKLAVLTIRDITKRHYAEISLRISEQRFRTAFDHIPDMVVLYDRSFRICYVNHAMEEATQRSASSLVGRLDTELRGNYLADLRRPLLQAALDTTLVQRQEFEFPSPRGTRYVTGTCVPLLNAKGQVGEVMCLYHDYTERKHAEERARQAALHDPLTELPNRALLFEYARHVLGGARRMHEKVAVLFIDLDRFKPINDMHGHEAGDEVLRQVSQRFKGKLREEDMVFRLGGDEFLIMMPRVMHMDAVGNMALHLLEVLNRPYFVGHLKLMLSASIGISLYPDDGKEIDTLINHADAAMYYAKQRGRNGFQFYEPEMSHRADRLAVIEQGLKRAIEEKEFRLFYQPVLDLHTGKPVCVEVLIRWPGNSVSADRFVPVAEATGLISPVGDWVLAEACQQHQLWKQQGLPAISIAINVSPVQFRRHDMAEQMQLILDQYGLDCSAIQLELTETAVMDEIDRAVDVLGRLKAKGIQIALDDFGTGYSSLNYLSRLPLNKLKIDQTFVQRIETDSAGRAITEAIIVLGRTLGLTVVAEGIESEPILTYLRERGCHEGQGYFICRPLAGEALAEWLWKNYPSVGFQ
jgi:diguanylate cyclase (GGDEF)-like protein/PAS domain S-box-containing protein